MGNHTSMWISYRRSVRARPSSKRRRSSGRGALARSSASHVGQGAPDLGEELAAPPLAQPGHGRVDPGLTPLAAGRRLLRRQVEGHEGEVEVGVDAPGDGPQGQLVGRRRGRDPVVVGEAEGLGVGGRHGLRGVHAVEEPEVPGLPRVVPVHREGRRRGWGRGAGGGRRGSGGVGRAVGAGAGRHRLLRSGPPVGRVCPPVGPEASMGAGPGRGM